MHILRERTMNNTEIFCLPHLDAKARAEVRASYAGETGAVWIYRGILFINYFRGIDELDVFAETHLREEKRHLDLYEAQIHRFRGSFLQFGWMIAGFLVGALPVLLGKNWVYYTIYRVESFVDIHYQNQIESLSIVNPGSPNRENDGYEDCVRLFQDCHAAEIAHRDEALEKMSARPGRVMTLWGDIVEMGSGLAVNLAKLL